MSDFELCSDGRRAHPSCLFSLVLLIVSCKLAGLPCSLYLNLLRVALHHKLLGFEIAFRLKLHFLLHMKSSFGRDLELSVFKACFTFLAKSLVLVLELDSGESGALFTPCVRYPQFSN